MYRNGLKSKLPLMVPAFYLVLYYASTFLRGVFFDIISIVFLVGIIFSGAKYKNSGWIFLLYLFGLTSAVASNFLIEYTSPYIVEIQERAVPTGGAARNAFLTGFFLFSTFIFFKLLIKIIPSHLKRAKKIENKLIKLIVLLGFVFLAYMIFVIGKYGSPLLMGADRFSYWLNIAPPGYRYISSLVPTFAFGISYALEIGLLRQSLARGWLIAAFVLLILGGEKFSGLIITVFFYYLPYFFLSNKRIPARFFAIGVMLFIAVVSLILINYYLIFGSVFFDVFRDRLALQGQMLYAIDRISITSANRLDASLAHFFGYGNPGEFSGIKYLMYLIAPHSLVDRYIENGVTFTAPFPANLSYFFGFYVSPIFALFMGLIVGTTGAALYVSLKERAFLLSLVSLKTFFYIYLAILMGEAYMLFDWKMVVYALTTIILFLVYKEKHA